ncbi:MAG: NADH-quinone oxidoreductase subunit F, partial [Firmicutes bacterium]|nr:NADH-quinone oxidoreductase subunit F [Bacillota bacterium]
MSQHKIFVCRGTGCQASNSQGIYEQLKDEVAKLGLTEVSVDFTGCHGFCEQGPIVIIEPEGIFYTSVELEDTAEIIQSHLRDGKPVERLFYHDPVTGQAIPHYAEVNFYKQQQRVILHRCGHINPENIDDSIAWGGYEGLKKALLELTPQAVIDEVAKAGLRGRGGAG